MSRKGLSKEREKMKEAKRKLDQSALKLLMTGCERNGWSDKDIHAIVSMEIRLQVGAEYTGECRDNLIGKGK